jgi:hypothetical protein
MQKPRRGLFLSLGFALSLGVGSSHVAAQTEPNYTIAFASFGSRNTDLFVADADGRNPTPLVPHADNDGNASFSPDGR